MGYIELKPQQVPTLAKIPGRVVPFQVAQVRPQISGIIQSRLFTEGALVKEGDQLYQIEPNRYQAEVDSAQANLNNANVVESKLGGWQTLRAIVVLVNDVWFYDGGLCRCHFAANVWCNRLRLSPTCAARPFERVLLRF